MNINRKERFERLGKEISIITEADPRHLQRKGQGSNLRKNYLEPGIVDLG